MFRRMPFQPNLESLNSHLYNIWCMRIRNIFYRHASTYHKSVSFSKVQLPRAGDFKFVSRKITVFPPPPSPTQKCKEPINDLTANQISILDPTGVRTHLFSRANPEAAKVGDVLLVRLRDGEPFAGVCINIRRRGVDTAILLRNHLTRVGVEMWYKIYSPVIAGIEVVQRRVKRARRARLTYMRKPKHDIGSVQNILLAYYRSKGALRGGLGSGKNESKRGNSGKKGRR